VNGTIRAAGGASIDGTDLRAMDPRAISIADVTYALPEDRIAQQPLSDRDASRLLEFRDGVLADHHFRELPALLPANALLVLNDTRVVNARLVFHRESGARIEVLCLEPADARPVEEAFSDKGTGQWKGFVGNAKRWKAGEMLTMRCEQVTLNAERLEAEHIRFTWTPSELTFAEVLNEVGHVPLPPYMKRADEDADKVRYNTVFARHDGSVAAPTASLHFTPGVLDELDRWGVATTKLTLHVGAGTFLPVKSERMADHAMHREQLRIPLDTLETLLAQLEKGPIVAVGTTAMRTLESIYWHGVALMAGTAGEEIDVQQWEPYDQREAGLPDARQSLCAVIDQVRGLAGHQLVGGTQLLIAPGYTFRFATCLITNFHQPQSTLLLLVAAFVGPEWRSIYAHALEQGYRFLSYGDGSLLWRQDQ